jgi:hypothetical protein
MPIDRPSPAGRGAGARRGKRGLEQVRPNPYVGKLLPEAYLKVPVAPTAARSQRRPTAARVIARPHRCTRHSAPPPLRAS